MCEIRLIIKSKASEILRDEELSFNEIQISVFEKPSYVVFNPDTRYLNFVYPNYAEHKNELKIEGGRFVFEYGIHSGRAVSFYFADTDFNETDMFEISELANQRNNVSNARFKNNISFYLKLIKLLLEKIEMESNIRQCNK